MKMKQKASLSTITFGFILSLMSVSLLVALPTDTTYAQSSDPCSTVPSGWSQTLAACENAVENGEDPCEAIFNTLEADGNDSAGERRDACRAATGGGTGAAVQRPEETCDPAEGTCCGDVKTSIIGGDLCGESDSAGESGTVYKLLIGALNILTAGIGIAAVGGIGYGALLYTTAESKPEQTKKAIGIITNVVIGIVAYGLMFVLLNFLIPGGVFTR